MTGFAKIFAASQTILDCKSMLLVELEHFDDGVWAGVEGLKLELALRDSRVVKCTLRKARHLSQSLILEITTGLRFSISDFLGAEIYFAPDENSLRKGIRPPPIDVRSNAPLPPGINWMKIGADDLKFDNVPKLAAAKVEIRPSSDFEGYCEEIRCKCCAEKAPRELKHCHRTNGQHDHSIIAGWMLFVFPYTEIARGVAFEAAYLCPKCGAETAKFIAHLRQPMIGDEDLL